MTVRAIRFLSAFGLLALLLMAAGVARPSTAAAQSTQTITLNASITTDRTQYRVGDPIQYCFTRPAPVASA